jgi:hypothetical protein
MSISRNSILSFRLLSHLLLIAISLTSFGFGCRSLAHTTSLAQESFPAAPDDRTLIYVAIADTLDPLPIETGATPLRSDALAANDKTSYIEIKGQGATKSIDDPLPRFYLFMLDGENVHPPFIVRLTSKRGARRVTAIAQKGMKGFAIYSEEIVKPHYRVLSRESGVLYLEIRPREALAPGEYAIIGSDLQRITTFRIIAGSTR